MIKSRTKQMHWLGKLLISGLAVFTLTYIFLVLADVTLYEILLKTGSITPEMKTLTPELAYIVITVHTVVLELVILFITLIMWKLMEKKKIRQLGIPYLKEHKKEFLAGLGAGAVGIITVFALLAAVGNIKIGISGNFPDFLVYLFVSLLLTVLISFAEQVFVRGYLISVIKTSKNIILCVVVSSGISALISLVLYGPPQNGLLPYINLYLTGGLFAFMYLRSGNIWMPFGFQLAWNFLKSGIFGCQANGVPVKGMMETLNRTDNIMNGGTYGVEGGLAVTLLLIAGFVFVWRYYKNKAVDFLNYEVPVKEDTSKKLKKPH